MKKKEHEVNNLKRAKWLKPIQFTQTELQVVLGVGKTKVSEWINDGRLPSYKIDGTVFVHSRDVVLFVEKHRRGDDFGLAI
jgi:excisionase family DNA binding protein